MAAGTAGTDRSTRPILHLFVANRGEIARRITRTCERLGIRVTVPPTGAPGDLDLLDIDDVVRTALAVGADAIHPGFGFLAENPEFAAAVSDAGMRWVGPPPAAIRAMGDKAAARQLASTLGIPVVPGYDGADQSDEALAAAASNLGLPILIKPAAGGGGKGMHIVRTASGLPYALASARREAVAAFGDDRLILERLLEGPRHIEVQLLFDAHGDGVHLGERDCSLQRRHQKILEESPSPAVDSDLRSRLSTHALALGRAVGYVGAGTCEFLATDDGSVYFLEMNTRLQVEHPVTELVTGRDLVEDQLRIAAGEPLGIRQGELDAARASGGHAVEVRVYAEDADDGFLPATGRVVRLVWPAGEGVRVDAGIDEGDDITGRWDPMLAKVIAHGRDRAEALDRLAGALRSTVVLGLITNLRFLRWVLDQPAVRDGQARIDTLDRIWPPDDWTERVSVPDAAWAAAAESLQADGWRLNAARRVRLASDDGTERTIDLDEALLAVRSADRSANGDANGDADRNADRNADPIVATSGTGSDRIAHVDVDGRSVAIRLAPPPDVDRAARAAVAHGEGATRDVIAPMPGGVIAVHVGVGSRVDAGDPIVTLEAMKMEHLVIAPIGGTVVELSVKPSDQVARGQVLAIVGP